MVQFSSLERGQILLQAVYLYFRICARKYNSCEEAAEEGVEKRKGASGDAPGSDPLMPDVDPHSHNVFGFGPFVLPLFASVFAFLCGLKVILCVLFFLK